MKKLLLLTLAIVTLTSLVYSQRSPTPVKNDWQEQGLKGKVKSCTNWEYGDKDKIMNIYTAKYDFKGNLIEDIKTEPENIHYVEGKLQPFKSVTEVSTYTNKYDDKGNKIQRLSKSGMQRTYKYDDKSNLIEEKAYNGDGTIFEKKTHKYDDKDNVIEYVRWVNKYEKPAYIQRETYYYNDKGNLIENHVFKNTVGSWHGYDSLVQKYTYKYDDKGNKIELKGVSNVNYYTKNTYKYDDNGNLIERNCYRGDGDIDFKDIYNGNLIETIHVRDNKKTTYKYDDKGNEIERMENGFFIEKFKYEYYE